jgi:Uncharacterized small protein
MPDVLFARRRTGIPGRILGTRATGGVLTLEKETRSVQRQIYELQVEHRDLDQVVAEMSALPNTDQLLLQRLKRRKLRLKDQIDRLKSQLIPDLDA